MKSSFLLLVALISSGAIRAQQRLVLKAEIAMLDTGFWSGWSKWDPNGSYGGPDSVSIALWFDDTLSIVGDAVSQTVYDNARFSSSLVTGVFDSASKQINSFTITGSGGNLPPDEESFNFTISTDSVSVEKLNDSLLTITSGTYSCRSTSNFNWSHGGGPESQPFPNLTYSSGSGAGSGPADLVVSNVSSGVTIQNIGSSVHIASISGGIIQIERDMNVSNDLIEIFDNLGRLIGSSRFNGNSIRISNLHAGFYFARIGDMSVKFLVTE